LTVRKGADGKSRKAPRPKKRRRTFNVERAAKAASMALDKIAKHWPALESRDALVAAVQAWLAVQSNTMAKAAE
jgi:hypothetical protein